MYGDSAYIVVPAQPKPETGTAQAAEPGKEDLIVQQRFLRTGETRGDRIAVLDGIKPGDRIVSEGQIKLQPNAHVVIGKSSLDTRSTLPKQ